MFPTNRNAYLELEAFHISSTEQKLSMSLPKLLEVSGGDK